jgi:hypothetical protein
MYRTVLILGIPVHHLSNVLYGTGRDRRVFADQYLQSTSDAGVLKNLSLAGLAKQSRLRYSRLRFGLAPAGYRGLGVHDRPVYTTNSQLIPQREQDEIPGVSPLSLDERD